MVKTWKFASAKWLNSISIIDRAKSYIPHVTMPQEMFFQLQKSIISGNCRIGSGKYMTKIMIVDDEKEATDLLENLLRLEGHESISVNDSTTASQIANEYNPGIFLLDLMMPGIDGFKLCRILRADPKFALTPILIITALNDTDSRLVAYGAGANDFLTKPYFLLELRAKIKQLLHESE
jgi:CheY-like chemotaxis protein